MIQEYMTYDLALGVYLALEGCRMSKFIKSEKDGKPVLQLKIINENPDKNIKKLVEHYEKDLKPFLGPQKRGKIAVNSGDRDFELSLLRTMLGR